MQPDPEPTPVAHSVCHLMLRSQRTSFTSPKKTFIFMEFFSLLHKFIRTCMFAALDTSNQLHTHTHTHIFTRSVLVYDMQSYSSHKHTYFISIFFTSVPLNFRFLSFAILCAVCASDALFPFPSAIVSWRSQLAIVTPHIVSL